jgi:ankyrin repeat protein
LFIF